MGIQTRFLAKTWFVRNYRNSLDRTVVDQRYCLESLVTVVAALNSRPIVGASGAKVFVVMGADSEPVPTRFEHTLF